jgi:hypothetical protein
MRLLEYSGSKFKLTKDLVRDIPTYAILSHTWGPDTEEVTLETWSMTLGRTRLAMRRLGSARHKQDVMAYDTSGWILAVSTNQTTMSSPRQSIPCFAGTRMRLDATYNYRISQPLDTKRIVSSLSLYRSRLFVRVNGLLEAGRYKSF